MREDGDSIEYLHNVQHSGAEQYRLEMGLILPFEYAMLGGWF